MIKILLLAVVPFMTQHRNVVPKTEVSTNFYGSVTGVVTTAYIQERSSIELPEKWALANVTNANGKSVRASDVGALGNSGSQTLNQSYNGLSVTFDAEGALYTGQYAPSKWSITKEVNDQYHYVQFFGFNGTNYPSFNLFDGESDFYIRLPRKEGTLALQSDVKSKADNAALTAHTENTDNPHKVTAAQVGAVPLVEDKDGNKTAVTIGSRLSSGIVGPGSLTQGDNVNAEGKYSYAWGYSTQAVGDYSRAYGSYTYAVAEGSYASGIRASTRPEDGYSFAWNGNGDPSYGVYYSHGVGTFNVNPIGGLDGFYIGNDNISSILLKKANKAIPSNAGNFAALTADGNLKDSGKTASDFAPAVEGGYLPLNDGGTVNGDATFLGNFRAGPYGDMIVVDRDAGYLYKYDSEGIKWYYGFGDPANEIAVKGDISATNPTFSNAVLAVGLNIDTNSVAVLNEIAATFGGFPIEGTATTVGGLLAALAAAAAWLKKNKVGSFKSVGGASATVENGVAKLDDFFTESNSLLTGRVNTLIDAKVGEVNAVLAAALDGTEVA